MLLGFALIKNFDESAPSYVTVNQAGIPAATVISLGPQRSSDASNVDFWSKKNVLLSPQSGIVMTTVVPSNSREVADPESAPCLGARMALV